MKLLYLSCDPGVPVFGTGGSSIHVQQIARSLRQLGQEVTIVSPNAGDAPEAPAGFRHVPLAGAANEALRLMKRDDTGHDSHLLREWKRVLYVEHLQAKLLPDLIANKPDAIYERYSLFGYAGVELARALRVPLLLEVNAPLAREAARHRTLVLRQTAEALERTILNAADALFVVSEELAAYAGSLGGPAERIHVVTTGVDPEQFRPDVSGDAVRGQHDLTGKRVVGFVGSLKPWHDLETVVAAVELLATSDPDVRLLVVGEGPQLDQLRARGDGRIVCAGAVPHDDVPAYVGAMDAVAVPYAPEEDVYFSPIKLFEAMAAGKPVIGARAGQVAELLATGKTGLLYAPGDARDLAAKIRTVFAMPDCGEAIGAAARASVIAGHTWEANARRIAGVAQQLVGARQS